MWMDRESMRHIEEEKTSMRHHSLIDMNCLPATFCGSSSSTFHFYIYFSSFAVLSIFYSLYKFVTL